MREFSLIEVENGWMLTECTHDRFGRGRTWVVEEGSDLGKAVVSVMADADGRTMEPVEIRKEWREGPSVKLG